MGILYLCIIVGVILFISVPKILANKKTETHGEEFYGIIVHAKENGTYVNGVPVMNGQFAVVIDGRVQMFTESLGLDCNKGAPGDCVVVKYYNNDINIVAPITFEYMPPEVQNLLQPYYEKTRPKKQTSLNGKVYDSYNDGRIY